MAYSVNSKKIKSLLKKGTLTGFEVAQIVMAFVYDLKQESDPELYESEGIGKHILNHAEIRAVKNNNLKENDKIKEYNNWILAVPTILTTIDHAHIMFLKVAKILHCLLALLESYLIEAVIRWDQRQSPGIMTVKQYKELQAKQREEKKKELHSLDFIISSAAWNLAPKNARKAFDPDDITIDSHPELYRKGKTLILKLIRSDKLKINKKKYGEKAKALLAKRKPLNATERRFLEKELISAEACYKAGLPGWKYIDLYEPNYSEEYGGLGGVAIMQNPLPYRVDEKGFYKLHESLLDDRMLGIPDTHTWERIKATPGTFFISALLKARKQITLFLFYRSVLKVVSEATSINFCEHPDKWYEDIKHTVDLFEGIFKKTITISERARKVLSDMPEIINLEELQIRPEIETKFRNRLSESPEGSKWLMDCQTYFFEGIIEKEQSLFIT